MKPVGLERNIEIAKLKGNVRQHPRFCIPIIIPKGEKVHDEAPRNWKPVSEWSTNRNDAWELWDELPKARFYEERCDGSYVVIIKDIVTIGKDFADCVSQAWIKWKQQ